MSATSDRTLPLPSLPSTRQDYLQSRDCSRSPLDGSQARPACGLHAQTVPRGAVLRSNSTEDIYLVFMECWVALYVGYPRIMCVDE